jgi:adenylate cyclase
VKVRSFIIAVVIGIVCAAAALLIQRWHIAGAWELKTYDWRMGQAGTAPSGDIALIYVDEGSLRHMEDMGVGWPWPRELYASMLNFLARGGARAVFFDIFFSEDSVYGVADDDAFANGIAAGLPAGLPVYLAVFATTHEGPTDPRISTVMDKMKLPVRGGIPPSVPRALSFQSLPIPPLVASAHSFGNVQSSPDPDGVYRRIPPAWRFGNTIVPSVSLKLSSDAAGIDRLEWTEDNRIVLGKHSLPLDDRGNMLLRYPHGLDAFKTYPMAEILVAEQQIVDGEHPRIDPQVFRDKIVVVGLSAPGLFDIKSSPLSSVTPGAFIHAVAISNFLKGTAIAPSGPWLGALIVVLAACIASLGLSFLSKSWEIAVFIAGLATSVVLIDVLSFKAGLWLPLVAPMMAMIFASTGALARNFLTEGRTKRAIKHAFGQYLSKEVVDEIAEDPNNIKLGGSKKQLTILFSDIADFTSISEDMEPEELVSHLNRYLSALTGVIINHRGTLDKYIGDAIMAFWGAPIDIEDHARRATEAALAMQVELKNFPSFATRIGVHTGEVVVGNIGSDLRFNYTAMGDAVNLASRMEGLNKYLGTHILISETTRRALGDDLACRMVGRVRVKGRSEPIDIFEPLSQKPDPTSEEKRARELFDNGIDFFTSGHYDKAHSLFATASRKIDDPVARFYQGVCIRIRNDEMDEPIDGVIEFEAK